MERFLYRLSQSPYAKQFVLKGGLMLRVWNASESRPTMDIDMLGKTSNDPSQIIRQMQEIIALRVEQRWHGIRPSIARNRANYQGC
jgi:Nucleotidyl transferase AbiEii toxin, Type IV TA system